MERVLSIQTQAATLPDTFPGQLALRMLLLGRHHRPVLGSSNSVQGLPGIVSEYEPSNLGLGLSLGGGEMGSCQAAKVRPIPMPSVQPELQCPMLDHR